MTKNEKLAILALLLLWWNTPTESDVSMTWTNPDTGEQLPVQYLTADPEPVNYGPLPIDGPQQYYYQGDWWDADPIGSLDNF